MGLGGVVRRGLALGGVALGLAACAAGAQKPPPAAAVMPQSALGSYLAARQAQLDHDYRDAARFLSRTLVADPHNLDLMRRTFVLRVSEGRVDEALPLARQLVAVEGDSGLAALVLLTEDIKSGDFAAASRLAAAMPHEGVERYAVPLLAAWVAVGRHDPAEAQRQLDAMGDVQGLEPLKDLHVALIAGYTGRVAVADAAYKRLIGDAAELTWRVVAAAGNFYERHGRAAEARRLYLRYDAIDTETSAAADGLARIAQGIVPPPIVASPQQGAAEVMFDLASLLNRRETLDAALIYVQLCLTLQPKFALGQMLAGEIREEQGRLADALAFYRAVDPASALSWSARLRAALTLDALGQAAAAESELRTMATDRPKRAEPLIALGDLLRSHSQFAQAVDAYDQAFARLGPGDRGSWRLYYSRGVALERSGHWPRAEADLKHALVLQPDQPLVLNYLGYSWIDRGENLHDALEMIKRAVALRPDDGYIVDSLGWAYYRLGKLSRATKFLEQAIELLPEDPTINDHLGDVYWRTGRVVEARYQWRRALQFGPEAQEMKDIEHKLDHGLAQPATVRGG